MYRTVQPRFHPGNTLYLRWSAYRFSYNPGCRSDRNRSRYSQRSAAIHSLPLRLPHPHCLPAVRYCFRPVRLSDQLHRRFRLLHFLFPGLPDFPHPGALPVHFHSPVRFPVLHLPHTPEQPSIMKPKFPVQITDVFSAS